MTEPAPEQIRQVNTSGGTLHVPALLADFAHGAEITYHQLLPGFERVAEKAKTLTRTKSPAEPVVADAPETENS